MSQATRATESASRDYFTGDFHFLEAFLWADSVALILITVVLLLIKRRSVEYSAQAYQARN